MRDNPNEYSIREFPYTTIIIGLGFIAFGIFNYSKTNNWQNLALLCVIGLFILPFSTVLRVNAHRITRTINISRRGLFQRYHREVQFGEISAIQIGSHYGRDSDNNRTVTYRVEIILKNGEVVPLRKTYSGGRRGKEKTAQALREFVGVGGMSSSLSGAFSAAIEMAKQQVTPQMREEQESITGNQDQIHEQNGIRWQLKTLGFGNMPITRWHAIDYFLPPTRFLYLAQKREGQIELPAVGFLDSVHDKLFSQSLKVYNFEEKDAPNAAHGIQPKLDTQLNQLFLAHASDEVLANHILNSRTKILLFDWAKQHPASKDSSEQMAILFSPTGLYLTMPGYINSEYLDELTEFGSELFLAQT